MSRAEETYDNPRAESLFPRYKAELLEGSAFGLTSNSINSIKVELQINVRHTEMAVRISTASGSERASGSGRARYRSRY